MKSREVVGLHTLTLMAKQPGDMRFVHTDVLQIPSKLGENKAVQNTTSPFTSSPFERFC